MSKVIGPGSCMVDITGYSSRLPSGGETTIGDKVRQSPGGKGSNQMIAASRAGADAYLIACIGEDSQADILKNFYKNETLNTKYLRTDKDYSTGTALIQIDTNTAQNRILIIRGANLSLSDNDVLSAEEDFKDADVVLCQLETADEPIFEAKRLAEKYSKIFILNPAPYRPLTDEFLKGIDYITPNETEAEELTGIHIEKMSDAEAAAGILLSKGVKNVIITLGSNGVFYTNGTLSLRLPANKVKAVETTGAGDAFNGAFAEAIGSGKSVMSALEFANCTAALSVTKLGAAESMPSRSETEEYMRKSK